MRRPFVRILIMVLFAGLMSGCPASRNGGQNPFSPPGGGSSATPTTVAGNPGTPSCVTSSTAVISQVGTCPSPGSSGAGVVSLPSTPPGTTTNSSCGTGADGNQYTQVYISSLSRWCVDTTIWASEQAAFPPFFPYGDQVIATLSQLFAVTPKG